jgi:hypothetical protein
MVNGAGLVWSVLKDFIEYYWLLKVDYVHYYDNISNE